MENPICIHLYEELSMIPSKRVAGETKHLILNVCPKSLLDDGTVHIDLATGEPNTWIKEGSKKTYKTNGSKVDSVLKDLWEHIKDIPAREEGLNRNGYWEKWYFPDARADLERGIETYLGNQ